MQVVHFQAEGIMLKLPNMQLLDLFSLINANELIRINLYRMKPRHNAYRAVLDSFVPVGNRAEYISVKSLLLGFVFCVTYNII